MSLRRKLALVLAASAAAALFVAGLFAAAGATSPPCWAGHRSDKSCALTTTEPATTTQPTTTTVATTTAPSPGTSGESMPVGDIAGWRQVFTDDFTTDVPLGSFPDSVSAKWDAYPYPWTGTPTWGTYDPHRTTSFHDGVQDIWIHTVNGEHLIAANEPRINGATGSLGQLYGRYVIRYRTDSFGYYKPSWLLWPLSETWPRDGEIDFPEQDQFSSTSVQAFMHRQNGVDGGDQDVYSFSPYDTTQWHTAIIEWLPSRCTFILDGQTIGNSTSRIPSTPMRYVIQNGGSFSTSTAPDSVQGHIFIDWVAIYAPA